jgi:hypothetical protein
MGQQPSDLRATAAEAYTYLYPLVLMEAARQRAAADRPGNVFHAQRDQQGGGADPLGCTAWLDLTDGPVLLHLPETGGRCLTLPMLDMWTDVFATVGSRSTGSAARDILLAAPGDAADLPTSLPVITAPTPHVWIPGRLRADGPDDRAAAHAVRDGLEITPLGRGANHHGGASRAREGLAGEPELDTTAEPAELLGTLGAAEFFTLACHALAANPPHVTDFSVLARIEPLGIRPGRPFAFAPDRFAPDRFAPDRVAPDRFAPARVGPHRIGPNGLRNDCFRHAALAELEAGAADARERIHGRPAADSEVQGRHVPHRLGVHGNNYLRRAVAAAAVAGTGACPSEDVFPLTAAPG